jgi:hypothetical protein
MTLNELADLPLRKESVPDRGLTYSWSVENAYDFSGANTWMAHVEVHESEGNDYGTCSAYLEVDEVHESEATFWQHLLPGLKERALLALKGKLQRAVEEGEKAATALRRIGDE